MQKKAFNRVDWTYLRVVLETLGLRAHMLTWIMALYSDPSAQVKFNRLLISRFSIRNGMRQSPLHLALVLEPLLHTVQENVDIKGYKGSGSQERGAQFQGVC